MKDRPSCVPESHHQRLGVIPGADAETLRQAFRRKSKALHPDTTDLPPEQASLAFQQLKHSYDVLLKQSQVSSSPQPSPLHPARSNKPPTDAWHGIGERRPLSGGEWFSLLLLSSALVLSLCLGLGVALAQGRDWQVSPTWLADEQTRSASFESSFDVRPSSGQHPAESALPPSA